MVLLLAASSQQSLKGDISAAAELYSCWHLCRWLSGELGGELYVPMACSVASLSQELGDCDVASDMLSQLSDCHSCKNNNKW